MLPSIPMNSLRYVITEDQLKPSQFFMLFIHRNWGQPAMAVSSSLVLATHEAVKCWLIPLCSFLDRLQHTHTHAHTHRQTDRHRHTHRHTHTDTHTHTHTHLKFLYWLLKYTRWWGCIFSRVPHNVHPSIVSCQHILPRTHSSLGVSISLLLCMNGLRKRSSGHVEPPFLAVKPFSHSVGVTIGQEPQKVGVVCVTFLHSMAAMATHLSEILVRSGDP